MISYKNICLPRSKDSSEEEDSSDEEETSDDEDVSDNDRSKKCGSVCFVLLLENA